MGVIHSSCRNMGVSLQLLCCDTQQVKLGMKMPKICSLARSPVARLVQAYSSRPS
jgi:sRNA-binding carbon storage regulator CsrA